MRMRLLIAVVAGVAVTVPVGFAAPAKTGIKATLKAPATQPKIDVDWYYSIRVTDLVGKPVAGRITAVIVDPFGGVHPVDYGPSEPPRPITNRPFKGVFRDYLTFPPESKGFKLLLKWTITSKIGGRTYRTVVRRSVTPEL